MRVGGDDGLVVTFAQRRRVLFDQHLEQALFARPSHIVPGVLLTVVHNAKVQPGTLEDFGRHLSDVRQSGAVRGIVTDEPQVFDRLFARIFDLGFERL